MSELTIELREDVAAQLDGLNELGKDRFPSRVLLARISDVAIANGVEHIVGHMLGVAQDSIRGN